MCRYDRHCIGDRIGGVVLFAHEPDPVFPHQSIRYGEEVIVYVEVVHKRDNWGGQPGHTRKAYIPGIPWHCFFTQNRD